MKHVTGMVLVMVLIFLLVMSLLLSAMLFVSQLSHKAAYAGQQQLQTEQQALTEHLAALTQGTDLQAPDNEPLAQCPAQFAAWSANALHCQLFRVQTATYSDSGLFYAGYSSLILRADLTTEAQQYD